MISGRTFTHGGAAETTRLAAATPPGGYGPAGSGELRTAAAVTQDDVAELFRAHQLGLVRLATMLVGDQETAEDVVQDVFTRVCQGWERLAASGASAAYFRTAVVNGCRSVHRRRGMARRFRGSADAALWAEPAASAEAAALLTEDRRRVVRALVSLPHRQREVLVLRYYQRLTQAEIAETLRISQGTVKSTISRGLTALGRKLGEGNTDGDEG